MANNVPQVLELLEFKTELQPDEGRYQGACRRLHRINTGVGVEREQRDDAGKARHHRALPSVDGRR